MMKTHEIRNMKRKNKKEEKPRFYCTNCGESKKLAYVRTTASSEWYICLNCKEEVSAPLNPEIYPR